jgi:integrase
VSMRRARGEGSVTFDASAGRWIGRLDLGRNNDGKRVRVKVTGITSQQARARLDDLRRERQDGTDLSSRTIKFRELADLWLQRGLPAETSQPTRDNYETLIRTHLLPRLGAKPVKDLTSADIDAVLSEMAEDGKAGRTIRHVLNLARRILRMGEQRNLLTRNIATAVQAPRGPTRERHGLTPEQARTLLAAAADDRLGNLITLSLLLGLRPGEAAALRWDDLDLDATPPQLKIRASMRRTSTGPILSRPKTATSWRTLALPHPAIAALRRQRVEQAKEAAASTGDWDNPLGLIFTGKTGRPLDPSNVRRVLARIARQSDIDHLHPHLLRHAAASLLSAAGVPLEDISDTLGHRSISVTADIYRHPISPVRQGHIAAMNNLVIPSESLPG